MTTADRAYAEVLADTGDAYLADCAAAMVEQAEDEMEADGC